MRIPFFRKKPVPAKINPPDENALKFINRTLELCQQGKLEWHQASCVELALLGYTHQKSGFIATYKTTRVAVILEQASTHFLILGQHGVIAFHRQILDPETRTKLEEAVWEHSIAKKFLDDFLETA